MRRMKHMRRMRKNSPTCREIGSSTIFKFPKLASSARGKSKMCLVFLFVCFFSEKKQLEAGWICSKV